MSLSSARMMRGVYLATWYGGLWAAGDFFAQFYSAHRAAAARRLRGEAKTPGGRPSAAQMYNMLDKGRLGWNFVFGLLAYPVTAWFERLSLRATGPLSRRLVSSCCALLGQQLVLTPALLLLYFNMMTALRGGFADPSFLQAYSDTGAQPRYSVWGVERRIGDTLLPPTLATSWLAYTPAYAVLYLAPFRTCGFWYRAVLLPWIAYVAYAQETNML